MLITTTSADVVPATRSSMTRRRQQQQSHWWPPLTDSATSLRSVEEDGHTVAYATLFSGALCGDAERSVFRLVEEHRMQDVLRMRRVSRSWRRFVDSHLSRLSHFEDGLAVKSKLWGAWSSRWEQLRRLEMPCVDLALLLAHGLSRATSLSHVEVCCTNATILRDFVRKLPALQHLELHQSELAIQSDTFAHSTALKTLCIEDCYGLDLRQMAAPEQLTRLDVLLSANLGSIAELAPQLATLNLGLCPVSKPVFVRFGAPMRFLRTLSVVDVEEDEAIGHLLASLKHCPTLQALNCGFELPAEHIDRLGDAFQYLTHLEYLALPDVPWCDKDIREAADYTWRMLCLHLTRLETLKWARWVVKADAVELMPNLKSLRRFVQASGGDSSGSLAWCFHLEAPPKFNFKQQSWHMCDFIPNSQALVDYLLGLEDFFLSAAQDYMSGDSPPYYWNRASLLKLLGRPAELHLTLRNYHCTFLDF